MMEKKIPIMTMGPICITPELKRREYGKILLDASIEKQKNLAVGHFVLREILISMGKSGFRPASEFGIRYHGLGEDEDASFFLCKRINTGLFVGCYRRICNTIEVFCGRRESRRV